MAFVVVFDTNILISAVLSPGGAPFQCLSLARNRLVQSVTCQEILDEFTMKLQTKFAYSPVRAQDSGNEIRQFSRLVTITQQLQVIAADPKDDKVLECAIIGGATHIVTGDRRHLLPMGSYQGIVIISAADFLRLVHIP